MGTAPSSVPLMVYTRTGCLGHLGRHLDTSSRGKPSEERARLAGEGVGEDGSAGEPGDEGLSRVAWLLLRERVDNRTDQAVAVLILTVRGPALDAIWSLCPLRIDSIALALADASGSAAGAIEMPPRPQPGVLP